MGKIVPCTCSRTGHLRCPVHSPEAKMPTYVLKTMTGPNDPNAESHEVTPEGSESVLPLKSEPKPAPPKTVSVVPAPVEPTPEPAPTEPVEPATSEEAAPVTKEAIPSEEKLTETPSEPEKAPALSDDEKIALHEVAVAVQALLPAAGEELADANVQPLFQLGVAHKFYSGTKVTKLVGAAKRFVETNLMADLL